MENTLKPLIQKHHEAEMAMRVQRLSECLKRDGIDAMLVSSNVNLYYLCGRVFAGYVYVTSEGEITYFVRRPNNLEHVHLVAIKKPENMADHIVVKPCVVALEQDVMSYSEIMRLRAVFGGSNVANGSKLMRELRSVKSDYEIEKLRRCAARHEGAYHKIPKLFQKGMSDIELQIELEHCLRLEGCLGQFRISGQSMELHMGNLLVGGNADNPSPYDFAMGGAGLDTSLPVGANGTIIERGMTVMVDMCGNFNGYMTDMTRCYYVSPLSPLAEKAHALSKAINNRLASMARPGMEAKALYEEAMKMVEEAEMADFFMGHSQKAGFIGHGVGIEVNEAPVIAPRSRDILQEGNVIALEPKFVIPGVGAVGVENTYVMRAEGMECITKAPEELIELV